MLSELRGSLLVGTQYLMDCHIGPGQFVAQVRGLGRQSQALSIWQSNKSLAKTLHNGCGGPVQEQHACVDSVRSMCLWLLLVVCRLATLPTIRST